jgi:hypothetical protein
MNRRNFLSFPLAAPAILRAQQGPPAPQRVEVMTPDPFPAIALNHLGFTPKGRKLVVVRAAPEQSPAQFSVRELAGYPKAIRANLSLKRVSTDTVDCLMGEFTSLDREGMYQVSVGDELSVPFFIRPDVWKRTLPKAVGYYRYQRCGVAVPGMHEVCHLDDSRRRDNGQRVDTVGGWHDAGDLRKWMTATMLNGIALAQLARNLGAKWDPAGSGLAPLHEELRWGNQYFLKMQDTDGLVFADVAGGVNGDNSDNHWTDNKPGTEDDRYLNPAKNGAVQAEFTYLEAMVAQTFKGSDYGKRCLDAALRCWTAAKHTGRPLELAWWTLAAVELYRATGKDEYGAAAAEIGGRLLALQTSTFAHNQKEVRGFWRTSDSDPAPHVDAVNSGVPGIALLTLAAAVPQHRDAARWRDAVKMHLDEYILPLCGHSPFDIVPYGVFIGSPTRETYRPLAGELTYRYFMPVRKQFWWLGTTAHLLSNATLLAMAERVFKKPEYRHLALRQLEWVMGANPFAACLMTGEGMRNPYPHSRFVGLIPGGIMNGIAGNTKDEPVLDNENGYDWRTTEYWSPHNAYYIWSLSVLERA